MTEWFPRQFRLTKPKDFKRVFASANRIKTPHFSLLYGAGKPGLSRLGLAIPKKQVKSAVNRNRIKRQVREYFRLHRNEICNVDIVVLARSKLADASNSEINKSLKKLWLELSKQCAK